MRLIATIFTLICLVQYISAGGPTDNGQRCTPTLTSEVKSAAKLVYDQLRYIIDCICKQLEAFSKNQITPDALDYLEALITGVDIVLQRTNECVLQAIGALIRAIVIKVLDLIRCLTSGEVRNRNQTICSVVDGGGVVGGLLKSILRLFQHNVDCGPIAPPKNCTLCQILKAYTALGYAVPVKLHHCLKDLGTNLASASKLSCNCDTYRQYVCDHASTFVSCDEAAYKYIFNEVNKFNASCDKYNPCRTTSGGCEMSGGSTSKKGQGLLRLIYRCLICQNFISDILCAVVAFIVKLRSPKCLTSLTGATIDPLLHGVTDILKNVAGNEGLSGLIHTGGALSTDWVVDIFGPGGILGPKGGTPAPGCTTPADGGTTQAHGGTTQAHGGTTQAQGCTTSADGGTTQAHGGTTPADGGTTQAHGGTTPAQGCTTPAPGSTAPATGCATPAHGGGILPRL